jgi:hypothetical protein
MTTVYFWLWMYSPSDLLNQERHCSWTLMIAALPVCCWVRLNWTAAADGWTSGLVRTPLGRSCTSTRAFCQVSFIALYNLSKTHLLMHTCIHAYIPMYVHTYVFTYIQKHIRTYLNTYEHSYIRTSYIHTYIHTYTCYIKVILSRPNRQDRVTATRTLS